MSVHVDRALLLIQQRRYPDAEKELGMALAESPNHPAVYSLLAMCLLQREKFVEATERAEEGVGLGPDVPFTHQTLARVWFLRNHLDKAEAAVREAIQLDPQDSDGYVLLAHIQFTGQRWNDALESAQKALEIDPEEVDALNIQAEALRKLGRGGDAQQQLREALTIDPDDPYTHASLGWNYLEKGDRKTAIKHFREALRLNPELDWARAGVVEALKAGNPLYRGFLNYIFWMQKLGTQGQWGVVLGAWFGYMIIHNIAINNPAIGVYLWPLLIAYIVFAAVTWFAVPLANLALRFHPFGRLALSRDERRASNWIAGFLLAALTLWIVSLTATEGRLLSLVGDISDMLALRVLIMCVPLAATFATQWPWPRKGMVVYTAIVGLFGLFPLAGILMSMIGGRDWLLANVDLLRQLGQFSLNVFVWGAILSLWAGNILNSIRWKK